MILRMILLRGIPLSTLGMLGASAILCALDLPPAMYKPLASLPVMLGCFAAAEGAARHLRRGGIGIGIRCAALLTILWYLAARVNSGHFGTPLLFMFTITSGIIGGIYGVNQPQYRPKKGNHFWIGIFPRIHLFFGILHKLLNSKTMQNNE